MLRSEQKAAGALQYSRFEDWADAMCLSLYPKHKDLSLARKVNLSVLSDVTAEHELFADLRRWILKMIHVLSGICGWLNYQRVRSHYRKQKAQSAGLQALYFPPFGVHTQSTRDCLRVLITCYHFQKSAAKIRTFCETTKHLLINLQIVY